MPNGGRSTPSSENLLDAAATASEPSTHPSLGQSSLDQTPLHTPIDLAEYDHVLCNASLEKATKLLPRALSNAIRTNPNPKDEKTLVADISMTFPNGQLLNMDHCQMTLRLVKEKVAHLAWVMFDTKLETMDGLRYFCVGEQKMLPNPKLTLKGCRLDILLSIFGSGLTDAIKASPICQDEVKRMRSHTDSVSMVISHRAQDGADIYVALGLYGGTTIKEQLYP